MINYIAINTPTPTTPTPIGGIARVPRKLSDMETYA